jgi:hypothetical protein
VIPFELAYFNSSHLSSLSFVVWKTFHGGKDGVRKCWLGPDTPINVPNECYISWLSAVSAKGIEEACAYVIGAMEKVLKLASLWELRITSKLNHFELWL